MPKDQRISCAFCEISSEPNLVAANALAFALRDTSPVTPLHTLILPRRHVGNYFELTAAEHGAIRQLLKQVRNDILNADLSVEGFNLGVNVGATAGQTIFHCHIHLIPRRHGDVDNPRGGVRAIIPGKQLY